MEEKQPMAPQDGVGSFTVATKPASEGGRAGEALGSLHFLGLCAPSPELLLKVVVDSYPVIRHWLLPQADLPLPPTGDTNLLPHGPRRENRLWRSLIPIHQHPGEGAGAGLTAVSSLVPIHRVPGVQGR